MNADMGEMGDYLPMSTKAWRAFLVPTSGLNWDIFVEKLSIVITSPIVAMLGDLNCRRCRERNGVQR